LLCAAFISKFSNNVFPLRQFVAEDPVRTFSHFHLAWLKILQYATVDAAGLNGSVRDGNWTPLNIGTANASIYKRTSEAKITLTADSISKKATMNYSGRFDVGEYIFLCSQRHVFPLC
jgi:hypothetical protein